MRAKRAVALAGVLCALLSGCAAGKAPEIDPETGAARQIPVDERPDLADLSGKSLDGAVVRLSDYRGKVVILNTWSFTCGPCRAEAPGLERFRTAMKDKGVEVLGITRDSNLGSARAFEKEYGLSYPSIVDPTGKQLLRLPRGLLNMQAIPFSVIIDRKGRAAAAVPGAVTEEEFRKLTSPLLKEPAQHRS